MAKRNVILLRGTGHEESGTVSSGPIVPGMLLQMTATGFRPHATAGGPAAAIYAREQRENTVEGAGSIDSDIPNGDEVTGLFVPKGGKVNAITEDTIDRGEFVQSAGGGLVEPFDSGEIIGVAAAPSDLSGDVGRVEITVI